jgi:hypothetical protein
MEDTKALMDSTNLIYNEALSKKTPEKQIQAVKEGVDGLLLPILRLMGWNAEEYYKKRQKSRKKLKKVHDLVKKNLETLLKKLGIKCRVVSASSFSADMNLVGESDIDFFIEMDESEPGESFLRLSMALSEMGFHFSKRIFNADDRHYYSFETIHRSHGLKVEIEVKVDYKYALT